MAGIIQTLPIDSPGITQFKDLGAFGLVAVAVGFLWKELHDQKREFKADMIEKDKMIKESNDRLGTYYKTMADALTAANRAEVDRVSGSLNDIKEMLEKMDNVRSAIAKP